MKKSWKRLLAVAVVLVLTLCVLSSCGDNTQAKIDEAVKKATDTLTKEKDDALAAAKTAADDALKAAQDAADAVKTELEGKVEELTGKLTSAEEATAAAVKEKEDAVAAAQAAAETAVAAAKTEAEEAAKTAADAASKALEDAVAAAKTEAEEAAKTVAEAAAKEKDDAVAAVQAAADATKAELEGKVADLTKKLEDAEAAALKGADEAVKNAQAAADATIKDLQDKLTAAEETAKTAAEAAAKEKDEAVAAAKAEAETAAKTAAEAAEAAKKELETKIAELETKVADYEKQIAEAAAANVETVEGKIEETVEEKVEEVKTEDTPYLAAVMTYADYVAAELDSEVTVEAYVQDFQGWWDGKITVYAQDKDGAYFIYNMTCSEEDSKKLVPGTKIKVHGFKSEWSGEVEITDATFEFVEGDTFVAKPNDVTNLIGKDELINAQNQLVVFKGLTVEAQDDGAAFNYKDAVGKTDDLYFKASKDGVSVSFCVEFYLRGQDSDVYKAVEGLQVGDVIDVTGYLYWYNGANPHVIGVTKAQ